MFTGLTSKVFALSKLIVTALVRYWERILPVIANGAFLSAAFIGLFSVLTTFFPGDKGDIVHLIGSPIPAYTLAWGWVAMIAIICGSNYAVHGGHKWPVGIVISAWWTVNLAAIYLLQYLVERSVEEAGAPFSLVWDFALLGAIDFASLCLVWYLVVKREVLTASVLIVIFCGYMVANLFGHTHSAYRLVFGFSEADVSQAYDAYMYSIFTVMLVLQAIGSGFDAVFRWSGSNVDLYRDIRPFVYRFIGGNFRLH